MLNGSPPLPPSAIHIEQAEVRVARRGERVEGEQAGVVVRERLLEPEQLAGRPAIIGRCGGILGRPFEQNRRAPA